MPKVKHKEFLKKLERSGAFSFRSVESRLGNSYAKLFIHNLKKQGRIAELIKGWYSFRKSPYLITVPLGEAYVGLGTAAFLHNAWGQVPNIDVLTPRAPSKVKAGERTVAGRKVIIRRISRRMYFGYESMRPDEAGEWVRVSDPEKTLIDLIYFNYPFLDEISPGLMEIVDKKRLAAYLGKIRGIRGSKKIERKMKELSGPGAGSGR